MPRAKRAKVVSLTKVDKKGKERKGNLISLIQENVDKWDYCWVFDVGHMRNHHLKTVRNLWKDTGRLVMGPCAVAAKALGNTPEEEYKEGLSQIAKHLKGPVGLFFTSSPPPEVLSWFASFSPLDFARSGNPALYTHTLPAGPVLQHHSSPPEPLPHSEDPQLKKLGLHTRLVRGVPTLDVEHRVCEKGRVLTGEQAQALKLVGEKMVRFRVRMRWYWERGSGKVVEVPVEEGEGEVTDVAEEVPADDEMDE